MILKLVIACCILVWNADCQGPYNPYQLNIDYGQIVLQNLRNYIPQFNFDLYGGRDNHFNPAPPEYPQQSHENNALGTEKRALTQQPNLQTQQQSYQTIPQPQITTYQPNLQSSETIYLQNQQPQTNYQQSQQQQFSLEKQNNQQNLQQEQRPNYQQNLQQQQQQKYQQNFQQEQRPNYQQNLQYQQQQNYQQNLQQQDERNYQQNLQQQRNYENSQQHQQQIYQQNSQQQSSYQKNKQQNYLSNVQPNKQNIQKQPQDYQHNLQVQQQNNKQNLQPQSYEQNYDIRPSNALATTNKGISSKFGIENTGKTSQNANYNNETFAITRFALKLLKGINSPGNVVLSPYSIAMLLALVQQGARGYTQQEITQALQLKPEFSADLFKRLTAFLEKRDGSGNVMKIANSLVIANPFNIDPKFKTKAIQNFRSDISVTNFNNSYQVVQKINTWVAGKTNEKIKNLLAPDALQPDAVAVLVNAVYFKGTWDIKFRPELTMSKDFTLSDGSKTSVLFMQARRLFQTDIDHVIKSQVLLLPFEGNQYSLMFILPLEGINVNDVMSSLTEPQLYAYQNMSPKEVKLEIPRFTVKQDSDITRLLNDLNIWTMFSNEADLSAIGSQRGAPLHISSGVHSAVLSIDENGGSAAAATAYSVVALSYDDPSTSFTANRPFIAILWDNQLSMPLFMSKIEDPSA